MLALARDHQLQGRVSGRVQSQIGVCETRYYQLLAGLLDRPEAAAAEPELVAQLRECATAADGCATPSAGNPPAH